MGKLGKLEKLNRIAFVSELLAEGKAKRHIAPILTEKWGIKSRMIDNILRDARNSMLSEGKEDKDYTRALAIQKHQRLIKELDSLGEGITPKDKILAEHAILKHIDDLQGNKAPEQREVKKTIEKVSVNFTVKAPEAPKRVVPKHSM